MDEIKASRIIIPDEFREKKHLSNRVHCIPRNEFSLALRSCLMFSQGRYKAHGRLIVSVLVFFADKKPDKKTLSAYRVGATDSLFLLSQPPCLHTVLWMRKRTKEKVLSTPAWMPVLGTKRGKKERNFPTLDPSNFKGKVVLFSYTQ